MIKIIEASEKHFDIIQNIATETWYATYSEILTAEQSEYMLDMMYSIEALKDQVSNKAHHFLLVTDDEQYMGYVSYELNYENTNKTKIHKLYVLPRFHGFGVGKILIDEVAGIAKENFNNAVLLDMNKNNTAVHFYNKMGFKVVAEKCTDIGNGYIMDDYVFEKGV